MRNFFRCNNNFLFIFPFFWSLAAGCLTVTRRPSSIMLMSDPKPGPTSLDDIIWHNHNHYHDKPPASNQAPARTRVPAAPTQDNSFINAGFGVPYVTASQTYRPIPINLDLPPGVYKIENAKMAPPGRIITKSVSGIYSATGNKQQIGQIVPDPLANPINVHPVIPVTKPPIYQPIQTMAMPLTDLYGPIDVYEARKMATVATLDPYSALEPGHVYHGHFAATRNIIGIITPPNMLHRNYPPPTAPSNEWWTTRFLALGNKRAMRDSKERPDYSDRFTTSLDPYAEQTNKQYPVVITTTKRQDPQLMMVTTMTENTTVSPELQSRVVTNVNLLASAASALKSPRPPLDSCGYNLYTASPWNDPTKGPPVSPAVGDMIPARRNEFPWQVWISLQHQQMTLFGSAAVIGDEWLLASGSFLRLANEGPDSISPLFGVHDAEHVSFSRDEGVFSVPVKHIEYHPSLDFALVQLVNPLNLTAMEAWYRVQPICLPAACGTVAYDDVCQIPGQTAWIAGWHYNLEDGGLLRKTLSAIVPNEKCEGVLGKEWATKDKLCTEGVDVCKFGYSAQVIARFPTGNSPKFALCGLATVQDCRSEKPYRLAVFSKVCEALDWIQQKTGVTTPLVKEQEYMKKLK